MRKILLNVMAILGVAGLSLAWRGEGASLDAGGEDRKERVPETESGKNIVNQPGGDNTERIQGGTSAIPATTDSPDWLTLARGQLALPGAMRVIESRPIIVNDAKFVLVAEKVWTPGKPRTDYEKFMRFTASGVPIDIQLHITNVSANALIFPTKNSFGVKLSDAAGKEMSPRVSQKKKLFETKPMSIAGGATFAICRNAQLRWSEETKMSELTYFDGTGAATAFGPLSTGATSWPSGTAASK